MSPSLGIFEGVSLLLFFCVGTPDDVVVLPRLTTLMGEPFSLAFSSFKTIMMFLIVFGCLCWIISARWSLCEGFKIPWLSVFVAETLCSFSFSAGGCCCCVWSTTMSSSSTETESVSGSLLPLLGATCLLLLSLT